MRRVYPMGIGPLYAASMNCRNAERGTPALSARVSNLRRGD